MREYIIADNQDITKAGMMFLLSKQKDVSQLLAVDNKTELIRELIATSRAPAWLPRFIIFSCIYCFAHFLFLQ